jgi:hypothetical protein
MLHLHVVWRRLNLLSDNATEDLQCPLAIRFRERFPEALEN